MVGLWIAAVGIGVASGLLWPERAEDDLGRYETARLLELVCEALSLPATFLAVAVVRRVTARLGG